MSNILKTLSSLIYHMKGFNPCRGILASLVPMQAPPFNFSVLHAKNGREPDISSHVAYLVHVYRCVLLIYKHPELALPVDCNGIYYIHVRRQPLLGGRCFMRDAY